MRDTPSRKATGRSYTPPALARFLARRAREALGARAEAPGLRVLDPAAGHGELLAQAQSLLAPTARFEGVDIDPKALARLRQRPDLPTDLSVRCADFLRAAPELAPADLILANPPYVRAQTLGASRAQALARRFGLKGRLDLSHAFLLAILEALAPGGVAAIVVTNRVLTTRSAGAVRAALRQRARVRQVWDLGDMRLFEDAVLPAILVLERSGPPTGDDDAPPPFVSAYELRAAPARAPARAADPIEALEHTGPVTLDDGRTLNVRRGRLAPTATPDGIWRLETDQGQRWLDHIREHTWRTFGQIGAPRVGVKSCADAVFLRDDWGELPEEQRPELLRPVHTHHIARRWAARPPTHRLLYPHVDDGGRAAPAPLQDHPRARAYLEAHRERLQRRTYLIEAGRRWYELWVPQRPSAWPAPKLVWRDIASAPTFWVDLDGLPVNGDCYWMRLAPDQAPELIWLAAAVANTRLIERFYDLRFHNKLYAGRRRYITQYVRHFPLPDPARPASRQLIELARQAHADPGGELGALEARIEELTRQALGVPG